MNVQIAKKTIQQELEEIRLANGGIFSPKNVVDYARNPSTLLHTRFTWDDSKAAELYRLQQARNILRVYVHMTPSENSKPIRVREFISLPSDRGKNGIYRPLKDILSDEKMRSEMLSMAKRELKAFRDKYENLSELSEVHKAIDKILIEQD